MPAWRASTGEWKLLSRPSSQIRPSSARSAPLRTLTRVDLPAPLSPTRAACSWASSSRPTSSRAATPPKLFEMASARSSAPIASLFRLLGNRPVQVVDLLHARPPLARRRLRRDLLHRSHELVPPPVVGIVAQAGEVAPGVGAVAHLAVHEQPPADEEDAHAFDAGLAQVGRHHRPGPSMVLAIPLDDRRVVPEQEGEPKAAHQTPQDASGSGQPSSSRPSAP